MATISDIENAIVSLCASNIPSGFSVYYLPGWPDPNSINSNLLAGKNIVNVYPFGTDRQVKSRPLNRKDYIVNATLLIGGGEQYNTINELYRQDKTFQINVWSSTPSNRETLAESIREIIDQNLFITLNDGSSGRIRYSHSFEDDSQQKANIYRRILFYNVEYSTTLQQLLYGACKPQLTNNSNQVVTTETGASVLVARLVDDDYLYINLF